jgi:hypothetical protein
MPYNFYSPVHPTYAGLRITGSLYSQEVDFFVPFDSIDMIGGSFRLRSGTYILSGNTKKVQILDEPILIHPSKFTIKEVKNVPSWGLQPSENSSDIES